MKENEIYAYGKHALAEALEHAPEGTVKKVFLAPVIEDPALAALLKKRGITASPLSAKALSGAGTDASHQGVIALIDTAPLMVPLDTFLAGLDTSKNPALALLGEIQDPHNVGAIIRSAAAFGFSGVLIPKDRQAPVTGAVIKASAGMAFRVPLVSIGNVNQTIRELKGKRFWIYGLSGDGANALEKESFTEPSVFVVGNEGSGIREKTGELCDVMLRIPIHPRTESLNAAVSAAIVMHAWSREHPEALR
jgi:23S rRNA (guanosine2251-2'-O)-methyltransferase